MQHGKAAAPHCVMGMDYYKLNERLVHPDGSEQGGVGPVLGYTWYSLTDQIDWNIQLRRIKGHVDPVGLYKLDRTPRDVASAFRDLCTRYGSLPLLADFPGGSMSALDDAGSNTDADQRPSSDAATRRERACPAGMLSVQS